MLVSRDRDVHKGARLELPSFMNPFLILTTRPVFCLLSRSPTGPHHDVTRTPSWRHQDAIMTSSVARVMSFCAGPETNRKFIFIDESKEYLKERWVEFDEYRCEHNYSRDVFRWADWFDNLNRSSIGNLCLDHNSHQRLDFKLKAKRSLLIRSNYRLHQSFTVTSRTVTECFKPAGNTTETSERLINT